MSNKNKTSKFVYPYGPKSPRINDFDPSMDITDQRVIINDPEALFEQFVVDDEIQDELDSENLEDFDSDIYDYEDRSDYGLDVAAANRSKISASSLKSMFGKKKSSKNNR